MKKLVIIGVLLLSAALIAQTRLPEAYIDNILIDGNEISSTNTNGDITISPNGTGSVVIDTDLDVDNININGNTISTTNTDGNLTLTPNGVGSVFVGTTFGVGNLDFDTNTISGTADVNISAGMINSVFIEPELAVDNLLFNGNTISSTNTNGDLIFDSNGSGLVYFLDGVKLQAANTLSFADADSSDAVGIKAPATVSTNYTLTLPTAQGGSGQILINDGSGNLSWGASGGGDDSSLDFKNGTITASVLDNELIIELKDKFGVDPNSGSFVTIGFRSPTITNGVYNTRLVNSALSLVIPEGATIGCLENVPCTIYVFAVDTGSGVVLGVANNILDEGVVHTSSSLVGSAVDIDTLYTASSAGSLAVRLIGKVIAEVNGSQQWASSPTQVATIPFDNPGRKVFATAFHGTDCSWSASGALTDPSGDSACTFSVSNNYGLGTISSRLDSGNDLPGIVFTPPYVGLYQICFVAGVNSSGGSGTHNHFLALQNLNTTHRIAASSYTGHNSTTQMRSGIVSSCGIDYLYPEEQTFTILLGSLGGSTTISNINISQYSIRWTILKL